MVQYKVHLKFQDNGKSFNEIITKALKMELQKKIDRTRNLSKKEPPCTHDSQMERSSKIGRES